MRSALVLLVACSGSASGPTPVIPAIHDHLIVFGQRIGPVSLGMSEAQLVEAVGKPSGEQSYGGARRALSFPSLKLHVVLDIGRVVYISPLDASYATKSGLHVGSKEEEANAVQRVFTKRDRGGVIARCYFDNTLVTIAGEGAPMPQDVCARGTVCDIALGGCTYE